MSMYSDYWRLVSEPLEEVLRADVRKANKRADEATALVRELANRHKVMLIQTKAWNTSIEKIIGRFPDTGINTDEDCLLRAKAWLETQGK